MNSFIPMWCPCHFPEHGEENGFLIT